MNNLVQIFFDAAEIHAQRTAIKFKDEKLTYGELREQVRFAAGYYAEKGIKRGDKVLVFVPMSVRLYETVLSLFSLGAVVVFVDEWADRARLRKALEVVPVDAIISPQKFIWLAYVISPFKQIKTKVGVRMRGRGFMLKPGLLAKEDAERWPRAVALADVSLDDTALITFTTGSTGLPKAADRTHGFLREQFRILSKEIDAQPDDMCLVTLPIVLLSILGTGATGVIADFNQKKPDELNVEDQLRLIHEHHVSMMIASPFYIDRLAVKSEPVEIASVSKIMTGGAPVFPDMAERVSSAFPSAQCLVAYGSTEAEPISVVDMKEVTMPAQGLKVGSLNDAIALKIVKIVDGPITLGSKGWSEWETEFGEIVVSGPHVLTQYYNSDEAFRLNKIVDGKKIWHRTGDSGRMVKGELFLNGRCSQLIKTEDGYQSLFIIEYQLGCIPEVRVGTLVDDKVILESEATEETIKEQLKSFDLHNYSLHILPHVPRDPRHHSKIDYEKLKEII